MLRKKSIWSKVIMVFFGLFLVVPLASSAAELKADLEFWCWGGTDAGFAKTIEEFSKLHPGVKIKLTLMGWEDVHTRVLAAMMSGVGAPDITTVDGTRIQGWFPLGGVKDISAQMKPYVNDLPSFKVAEVSYKGKIYGVPIDTGPGGLFYHADLFREAGINPEELATWDAYNEIGQKFYSAMGPDKLWTTFDEVGGSTSYDHQSLAMQLGGGFFDKNFNVVVDSDPNLRALELVKKWHDLGFAHNQVVWDPTTLTLLDNDSIATLRGPVWHTDVIKGGAPGAIGEFRVIRTPAFEEGGNRAFNGGGSDVVITAQCPDAKLEAAWKWLEYTLLTVESVKRFYLEQHVFPAYLPVFKDPVFDKAEDFFGGQKGARFFAEVQREVLPFYMGPHYSEAMDITTPYLQKAIAGKLTPEQALKEANAELIAAIKE